ncbi:DUF1674 domain-containing protein [Jiella sp. M17.18]|uniref:DUF1674 domain-containing protein n=1 Tax=Jiella sp. M17.18 TaxID=3234247 RepID=UPI0034DE4233
MLPADGGDAASGPRDPAGQARALSPAARRALAEAEERRARHAAERVHPSDLPPEVNGRDGPEPIRYGDWEKNGIISDF